MPSKRISQREAVRTRRALRKLRAFVEGISGTYKHGDVTVFSLPCSDAWPREKMRGMSWGTEGRVVFVADTERESGKVFVVAYRVPEVPDVG